MKILLVGSGAREHALAKAIARSPRPHQLYYAGSHCNPGIAALSVHGTLQENVAGFASENGIQLAIIGPEKPLSLGLADDLRHRGIAVVGPIQALAQIETSKGFTRDLMRKYAIPGLPHYQRFSAFTAEAEGFLRDLKENYVLKADGLRAGKGVSVSGEHVFSLDDAKRFCQALKGPFVIEEKLVGPEFSLLSFSDGKTLAHMPPVQDHKRLLVGDKGPNTGGMGSYTMADHRLAFLSTEDIAIAKKINQDVIVALQHECTAPYQGVIYGGFMKTAKGIKVIEYNARFGDPEAINLLGLLTTDFISVCEAITLGKLDALCLTFAPKASVCHYLVPQGYPDKPRLNDFLDLQQLDDREAVYYASVAKEKEQERYRMLGSRALAVLGIADTLNEAKNKVARTIAGIQGNYYYRNDIGENKYNV